MKVAISFFNSILGGPREVSLNLLKQIPQIDTSIDYIVFTDSDTDLAFLKDFQNVTLIIIKKIGKYDLFFWEQLFVLYYSIKEKVDVFHGTKNSVPLFGFFKKICTIHDLAYYILPDTFSFMQRVHLKVSCIIAKIVSDRITAVSENTSRDIQKIIGVDSKTIDVIYNSINDEYYNKPLQEELVAVKQKYTLPDNFFLHVGTLQPRKNIATIIDAFKKYKEIDKEDFYLVLAGRKGWYYKELIEYVENSGVANSVIFTGPITNEELKCLYNLSYLFIYASNYDGFGLVPLEAMSTSTATICSNVSSLPEVVGDAAIAINPKSSEEIYDAMVFLQDKDNFEKYCMLGYLQSKKFSWKDSAKKYVELYKNVYGG